jgi:hypothetical protein
MTFFVSTFSRPENTRHSQSQHHSLQGKHRRAPRDRVGTPHLTVIESKVHKSLNPLLLDLIVKPVKKIGPRDGGHLRPKLNSKAPIKVDDELDTSPRVPAARPRTAHTRRCPPPRSLQPSSGLEGWSIGLASKMQGIHRKKETKRRGGRKKRKSPSAILKRRGRRNAYVRLPPPPPHSIFLTVAPPPPPSQE